MYPYFQYIFPLFYFRSSFLSSLILVGVRACLPRWVGICVSVYVCVCMRLYTDYVFASKTVLCVFDNIAKSIIFLLRCFQNDISEPTAVAFVFRVGSQ